MVIPRLLFLSTVLSLFACGQGERPARELSSSGGRAPVPVVTRWRIIDSSSVGRWWGPMVDSATVYRVRVSRGADQWTLRT